MPVPEYSKIELRKATVSDLSAINDIYEATHIAESEDRATIGWRRFGYPNAETSAEHLAADDLYVMTDSGKIVATAVINHKPLPEYTVGHWAYEAPYEEILILHTFIVHPSLCRRGYGHTLIERFEDMARKKGLSIVRLDTQAKNTAARRLYASMGYREAEIVDCHFDGMDNLRLVLIEKRL